MNQLLVPELVAPELVVPELVVPELVVPELVVPELVVFEPPIVNRGVGADGANTNQTGKTFEDSTDNLLRMCKFGFVRGAHWIEKQYVDKYVIISKQRNFGRCVKHKYNIDNVYRWPDEAYVIEYPNGRKILKILEKKMQNREGSVETKIFAGPSLKREYELMFGSMFEVQYGFCVSAFLQKKMTSGTKKYNNLLKILKEHNIPVLFGDDANYFETLDLWIHSDLSEESSS